MAEFRMPSLGADMEAGTLTDWLVKAGDTVQRGDIIAVVETQKGAIEIEVFQEGVVEDFLVQQGTRVPVGTPLAIIRGELEEAPTAKPTLEAEPVGRREEEPVRQAARPVVALRRTEGELRASPAARKLAEELSVDLSLVTGTGPGGAIVAADVESAAEAAGAPARLKRPKAAETQKAIAAAMEHAKREIPHYYLSTTINLEPAMNWLEKTNAARAVPERLIHGVLYIKAMAQTLRNFPELNGYWVEGEFRHSEAIHTSIAISLRGGGLVAPALHDADRKDLDTLMGEFRDLVMRARAGKLRSSELSDATITITSLGEEGVDSVFPIIYPPQVAIVGVGTVVKRPWQEDDNVSVSRVVTLSLAGDHRVSNGHRGALFLRALGELLQQPKAL